jgi:UDPglucose 6-dehydrogenase
MVNNITLDIIFICLPCITEPDGTLDVTDLEMYLAALNNLNNPPLIVIKSTITPYYLKHFKRKFTNLDWLYNPEFIRANHAEYDMANPVMHVVAGDTILINTLELFYIKNCNIGPAKIVECDLETASLVKYFINTWLATKVTYMNEFHKLFKDSGSTDSWDRFIEIITNDPRIGKSHLNVPGPDGEFGFGGFCFPKDTEALLTYAKHRHVELDVLSAAVDKNNDLCK